MVRHGGPYLHLVVRVKEAMEVLSTRELLAELARMVEVGKRTELPGAGDDVRV